MRGAALFGMYVPADSWLHRLGAGWTYLLVLVPSLAMLILQDAVLAVASTICYAALLLSAHLPVRAALGLAWPLVVLLVLLLGYNASFNTWQLGVALAGNVIACLYASRLLIMTTPAPALIDALIAVTRPLDRIGFNSERFGLAVAIMLRSIPYLLGSFDTVRDAARARGQERNLVGQITPVVVDAVAYAQRTGEALAARGLGERREQRTTARRRPARGRVDGP